MLEKFKALKEKLQTPRAKKIAVWAVACVIVFWVLFRITMIVLMGRQVVFNTARAARADGAPVNVIVMERADGVIKTPLAVRNNKAFVSGATVSGLKTGMQVASGQITSVGASVDLDSGMHVVRTQGVADGLQFAEYRARGYFVPAYAVTNNTVMVVVDGVAVRRPVKVARSDSDNALITDGLADGDQVVVSHIADGAKVKVVNQ